MDISLNPIDKIFRHKHRRKIYVNLTFKNIFRENSKSKIYKRKCITDKIKTLCFVKYTGNTISKKLYPGKKCM